MPRFSVAVSEALLARIDEVAFLKGKGGDWYSARPWSRDATAAWLLGQAIQRLEELNQLPMRALVCPSGLCTGPCHCGPAVSESSGRR